MIFGTIAPMLIGFAVFMIGMKLMEMALHRSAGPYLSRLLHRFTATPLHGLAVGTATSAFLQSSTAVTVIAIGMVNAGLLTFPRTLGIVLGTNIGTCLTTELIGLNLNKLALPLLMVSLGLWLITALLGEMELLRRPVAHRRLHPLRSFSLVLGGFALLLTGMSVMQSIGPAVQASPLFGWFIGRSGESILWGLTAGTVLTALVHSSAAVIGMVMGLCAIGAMPTELGVAVVLGANVGTCVTAVIASIGGTQAGRYVALFHVGLNIGGALLFAPFTRELAAAAAWFTSAPAGQIAHAQTLFNIISSLLALPLCYFPRMFRLRTG
ncbi:Na/Pi cotransporter family protein [Paenibacillus beijingensis]|uniref:Sodium:phosphate symporter n=1 Tax=Paenibacillus beijingensis TaxID=1126833 RepID=A0A0D5NLV9_9BACL|nr:Na/Pi symporter [Paenibacillus beijingensis]AJY76314.1 sodium:phosphate symporter [Paenibacillus beijingensis]